MLGTPELDAVLQGGIGFVEQAGRDLARLEKQASKNGAKINADECKVLQLRWDDTGAQCRLGSVRLGRCLTGSDLGVLVANDLNGSQQCTVAAAKARGIWGCTHRGVSSSDRDVIIPPRAASSSGPRKSRRTRTEWRVSKGGPRR